MLTKPLLISPGVCLVSMYQYTQQSWVERLVEDGYIQQHSSRSTTLALALCFLYVNQIVFLSISTPNHGLERQKNLRKCDPFIDVQLLALSVEMMSVESVMKICDELGGKDWHVLHSRQFNLHYACCKCGNCCVPGCKCVKAILYIQCSGFGPASWAALVG